MAKRTGYSRNYIGNVETGVRAVTPDVIREYESVLGEDLKRRQRRTDQTVTEALISALRLEPSRENLRAIGATLAGVNPLKI